MKLVWPYIVAGVVTAIACFGVQLALGQPASADVRRVMGPVQWQQQSVHITPETIEVQQMRERERHRAELVREELAAMRESKDGM